MSHAAYGTRIDHALETAVHARKPQRPVFALVGVAGTTAVAALLLAAPAPAVAVWLGVVSAAFAGVAAAIATARTRRMGRATAALHDLARTDAESGLLASHALWSDLPQALARSHETDSPMCVVMVRFDGLSALHQERDFFAGQRLLRQIARATEATAAGHSGVCYRAHSASLVVVLENTSLPEAERVAQKLSPVLLLLERKNTGRVQLTAGAALAVPGDVAHNLVQRAARRCQIRRSEETTDSVIILGAKPLTTH